MKRGIFIIFFTMTFFLSLNLASAALCNLDARLINQDPYPATPGDYVDVVFQLDGVSNPECGVVTFRLVEGFPFSLDPGVDNVVTVRSGTYTQDFSSFLLLPFKLRVDRDALDGESKIEVRYSSGSRNLSFVRDFDITIEDQRTDFEVSIRDYDSKTNTLTFEILNVGKYDVEALTIDIPNQENIIVKGSKRNIVGSLDSNEDTSFSFEAIPSDGLINLEITYTDGINQRRTLNESVAFDSSYFEGRIRDQEGNSWIAYIIIVIVLIIIFIWYRRKSRKKHKHHHEHN